MSTSSLFGMVAFGPLATPFPVPVTPNPLPLQANPAPQQQPVQPQPAAAFGGMTWQGNFLVCVVCGGICKATDLDEDLDDYRTPGSTPDWMRPILVQAKPEYLEWQKECPSIRRSYCAELVEQIKPTTYLGGGQGLRLGSDTLHINTRDPLMRIPIHPVCFQISQIFCKDQIRYGIGFRNASGGAPSSIPQLYEIWCKRAIASNPLGPMTKPILEANMYSGAPAPLGRSLEDYVNAMIKDRSLTRFLAHPLAIPSLTDLVVNSNLQTMDGKMPAAKELVKLLRYIQNMPQEISDQILGSLEPFEENRGPPLEPTRILPPIWWKNMLLSGKLIPWLWDLNENDIVRYRVENFYHYNPDDAAGERERGEYVFDENTWDWELLCRQLAQPNVMERWGILEGKSERLWNRRRIWKLLDAARLGHIRFS